MWRLLVHGEAMLRAGLQSVLWILFCALLFFISFTEYAYITHSSSYDEKYMLNVDMSIQYVISQYTKQPYNNRLQLLEVVRTAQEYYTAETRLLRNVYRTDRIIQLWSDSRLTDYLFSRALTIQILQSTLDRMITEAIPADLEKCGVSA